MKRLKLLLSILREELREATEATEEEEQRYRILEEIERVKVKIKLKELGWDRC